MSTKKRKKRTKPYTGADAAPRPHVQRYSVGNESAARSWWKEHKRTTLVRAGFVAAATLLSWLIYNLL